MFSLAGTSVTTGDVHPDTAATGEERDLPRTAAAWGRENIAFAGLRHATDTGTAWLRSKWKQFLTKGCS